MSHARSNPTRRTLLITTLGFPAVYGLSPGTEDPVVAMLPRWRAAVAAFRGLTEDEYKAGIQERALFAANQALLEARPNSGTGILAKLQSLMEIAPIECGGTDEFPFPSIRIIISDLKRLGF